MRSMPEAFPPDGDDIPDAAAAMAPSHLLRLGEWRTVGEYVAARLSNNAMSRWPCGDGHPVLVIRGFSPVGCQHNCCVMSCASGDIGHTTGGWAPTSDTGPA